MALKLTVSESENCVRSVGDHPNGILGIDCSEGGASWAVSATFDPSGHYGTVPEERTTETQNTPLTVAEVVAACDTMKELGAVFAMATQTLGLAAKYLAPMGDYRLLREHVDLLEETHAAVNKRILEEDQAA